MVSYNSVISRTDAEALMSEKLTPEFLRDIPQQSFILQLARRLPDMTSKQQRMPVLSAMPVAGFVNGDTGLKPTSNAAWANKYLDAEELAVIIPIPEAVLMDSDYDLWGMMRPLGLSAIGKVIDQAILFDVGTSGLAWPDAIVPSATAAGNTVSLAAFPDLYDATMGEGGLLSLVEADGYNVTGHIAKLSMKSKYRGLRDANGNPIFVQVVQDRTRYELDGAPIMFPTNGAWDDRTELQVSGDFNQLVYAIRQDFTFKILDQAVITDNAGHIVWNLPQQDMLALRIVFRMAWQVPNPINRVEETEANRYPFAVLTA